VVALTAATPLRVAIVSPYSLASIPALAPERLRPTPWTENLARALVKRADLEVHLLVGIAPHSRGVPRSLTRNSINFHFYRTSGRLATRTGYRWESLRVRQILRHIKPDVVHGQGVEGAAGAAALRSGYPALITVHGILNRIFANAGDSHRRARQLELEALNQAHHIIALNDYTLKQVADLREDKLTGLKTYRIANAVAPALFDLTQPETAVSQPVILFCGVLRQRKGLLDLLQALVLLKQQGIKPLLQVAGIAPGDPQNDYHNQVTKLIHEALPGQVELLGLIAPADMPSLYDRSDLLVLPSYHENAPMVIAEAMAAALPVVAYETGGVGEMVTEGETGFLVAKGTIEQLAIQIGRLLGDTELRLRMGREARKQAARDHHPDVVAEQTVAAYRSVLSSM
jgi:glycosyltransferase involved in cell wall biosynthesis